METGESYWYNLGELIIAMSQHVSGSGHSLEEGKDSHRSSEVGGRNNCIGRSRVSRVLEWTESRGNWGQWNRRRCQTPELTERSRRCRGKALLKVLVLDPWKHLHRFWSSTIPITRGGLSDSQFLPWMLLCQSITSGWYPLLYLLRVLVGRVRRGDAYHN